MKKKKLFLLLGCCCVLSGYAAGELTFEEKCTAVYKWFTALHKDNEYIFTLRNVKDKKALREIIFDFCSTNDFEFIIEKEDIIFARTLSARNGVNLVVLRYPHNQAVGISFFNRRNSKIREFVDNRVRLLLFCRRGKPLFIRFRTLFMPQFLKNPAKPPWQEKLAAWLVLCRREILSVACHVSI